MFESIKDAVDNAVLVPTALTAKSGAAQSPGFINVQSFGASGDGYTENTDSFQRAFHAAALAGGGVVYAPPGSYRFAGPIVIPSGVHLRGSYSYVPSHPGLRYSQQVKPGEDGTALFVTAGRGSEEGTPFISMSSNSTVSGLVLYYPDQVTQVDPIPYPWAIAMQGVNCAVLDVELLNPYQGITTLGAARHNIRNVTGQPLRRGIFVDAVYDIGRIENIHFNPWWSFNTPIYDWQFNHGEAFAFGHADWEFVLNTFAFGYHVGYRFLETCTGRCNGNFLGIAADDCNRAVLVESSAPYGLLITNGEFTAFHGDDPTAVEVTSTHNGVVRFENSSFWGPGSQVAKISGQGVVAFVDCTYDDWAHSNDRAAIQAESGSILVLCCEFRQAAPHVLLGENVERAVIASNLLAGPARIENRSKGAVEADFNVSSVL